MFSGKIPFFEVRQNAAVLAAVLGGTRPSRPSGPSAEELTEPIWELMQHCWSADPATRPTLTQISVTLGFEPLSQHILPAFAEYTDLTGEPLRAYRPNSVRADCGF